MLTEKNAPVRIAVLVSGGGTNLQALLDAEQAGILHSGKIVRVLSNNPNAFALQRAERAGIAASVFRTEEELKEELSASGIEMIVLAGFLRILSPAFCRLYAGRMINIHPSLIPSFCGKGCYGIRVHEKALSYGVKVTGATVHFVNHVPDGGRIIAQKAVAVKAGDTPEILQKRVMDEAEHILLPQATEEVAASLIVKRDASRNA